MCFGMLSVTDISGPSLVGDRAIGDGGADQFVIGPDDEKRR